MNLILRAWLPKEKRMLHHDEISLTEGKVFERIYDERTGYMNSFEKKDAILMISLGGLDKKDSPIFDGDVAIRSIPFGKLVGIVRIRKGFFEIETVKHVHFEFIGKGIYPMSNYTKRYEILGNIYEDPALLMDYPELLED